MRSGMTLRQIGLTRGTLIMAAPRKYLLELRDRAVQM